MKKLLAILLSALMISSSTLSLAEEISLENNNSDLIQGEPLSPHCNNKVEQKAVKLEKVEAPAFKLNSYTNEDPDLQELADTITEGILNHEEDIDISAFNIKVNDFDAFYTDYYFLQANLPSNGYGYSYYTDYDDYEDYMAYFSPTYLYDTLAEQEAAIDDLNLYVNQVASYASGANTDYEKAFLVYSKISIDNTYDNDFLYEESYTAYGAAKNRVAVCQGFTMLSRLIFEKLGISNDICRSDAINHMWNYVKINDNWYHFDVTWSFYSDLATYVSYKTFLRSDATFENDDSTNFAYHGIKDEEWIVSGMYELPDCSSTEFESDKYLFNSKATMSFAFANGNYRFAIYSSSNTPRFTTSSLTNPCAMYCSNSKGYTITYFISHYSGSKIYFFRPKYVGNKFQPTMSYSTLTMKADTTFPAYGTLQKFSISGVDSFKIIMLGDDMVTPLSDCLKYSLK